MESACLVSSSSDLAIWLEPGRRVIERAWAISSEFAVCLTGTLLDAGWGGIKQFGLKPFYDKALSLLNAEDETLRLRVLRVLSKTAKFGHLKSIGDEWKGGFAKWSVAWLQCFTISEDSVSEYYI